MERVQEGPIRTRHITNAEQAARARRRKKRRRRQLQLRIASVAVILVVGVTGVNLLWRMSGNTLPFGTLESNTTLLQSVLAGQSQEIDYETMQKLETLAKENETIASIVKQVEQYPEKLLISLSNNEELADFVKNYSNADGTVTGGFTKEELGKSYPLLLQWDERWGYVPYGDSVIGVAGCGPTCLSMVTYALTGDETITPDQVANYSMTSGFYVKGVGTDWGLMTLGAKHYGLEANELSLSEEVMKAHLDMGEVIICAMGPGDFTTAGHFIMIYGYGQEGFLINDPNSRIRSSVSWTYDEICYQIKNLWAFSKKMTPN